MSDTQPENARRASRPGLVKMVIVPSILVFIIIYLLSGICIVKPEQVAIVTRFGKLRPAPLPPGTHYRLPYPIDKVTYIKPNEVKSVVVGPPSSPEDEGEIETYYIQPGLGSEFLTGDENIIHITLNVQYKVGDSAKYLFNTAPLRIHGSYATDQAGELVRLAAEIALADVVAHTHVDDLITSGKQWVLNQVKERAQRQLDKFDAGALIISANFESVSPPAEVGDAFKDVASALEDCTRFVNEATGEYNAAIPRARGEAARQLQEALATKKASINRAQGDANRFLATLKEYRIAREAGEDGGADISLLRLYIETMEEVMPRMKKYIVDTESPGPER